MDAGLTAAALPDAASAQRLGREEVREIVVGLVAVVLFMTILIASYLGLGASASGSGYLVHAAFNRVDGLAVGDSVEVGGVPIGEVEAMALAPNFRARVSLRIDADLSLPADTSAAIHTDGLFGGKSVVLEPGGDEQLLKPDDVITFTQDSLVVSDLLELIIAEGRAQRAAAGVGEGSPGETR